MDLKNELKQYIEDNLITLKLDLNIFRKLKCLFIEDDVEEEYYDDYYEEELQSKKDINNYLEKEIDDNNFQTLLFKYIDESNLKDSDIYNKVNIDRRLFSKIRNNKNYHPKKNTIILFAIALKLDINGLEKLLESASYSLPKNNKFDLIIRFCFLKKIYDINIINELLYDYNYKTLN